MTFYIYLHLTALINLSCAISGTAMFYIQGPIIFGSMQIASVWKQHLNYLDTKYLLNIEKYYYNQ